MGLTNLNSSLNNPLWSFEFICVSVSKPSPLLSNRGSRFFVLFVDPIATLMDHDGIAMQLLLAEEEEDTIEDDNLEAHAACGVLILHGVDEAHRLC